MNIFEKASRGQYRFNTLLGSLPVEALWRLPLRHDVGVKVSLESVYTDVAVELKAQNEIENIFEPKKDNEELNTKFEIVKYIIDIRMNELNAQKAAVINKQKKQDILNIINLKNQKELENKDIKELTKMLEEL